MKQILLIAAILPFWVGVLLAGTSLKFGVITDIHHTNQPDSLSRRHSAALKKTGHFIHAMNRLDADFIIELGDLVETVAEGKDPTENFNEVETIFSGFRGPRFHVLGNHEFDNLRRSDLLPCLKNSGVEEGRTFYSFDLKGVHFVVLDADYTVDEPHRPFDLQDPENMFWNWKDAWIPQEEIEWIETDLLKSNMPTVIFTHQLLHRDEKEDHAVKNASVIRNLFEKDGQVIAVFSGHDHRGEVAVKNGIHYFVLEGNVGMSVAWPVISATGGMDARKDNPFTLVEIRGTRKDENNDMRILQIKLTGNAQQYTYMDQVRISTP